MGLSAAQIVAEAQLGWERVLRAPLLVCQVMVRDVPPVFSGTVEVDETYLKKVVQQTASRPVGARHQARAGDHQAGGTGIAVGGYIHILTFSEPHGGKRTMGRTQRLMLVFLLLIPLVFIPQPMSAQGEKGPVVVKEGDAAYQNVLDAATFIDR